ncbi:MAG: hypothetical protein DVB25_06940 [Verrucomicrobia bacterium]|nr:MAG: hypothetical protein DVB25_06940 [Verrucomicrobiota bacterium]
MSTLDSLQKTFQAAVLAENLAPGLFAREGGEGGFSIYANAYRARLTDALRDNYPILLLALGDEMFLELALSYIGEQPSRQRSICWFGHQLADFMRQRPDRVPHPALADLASMDWALRGVFDAADQPLLRVEDLSALPAEDWPGKRFQLRATVAMVELSWNVEPIWQALSADAEAQTSPPHESKHLLLAWRKGLDCKWRSLASTEAAALRGLSNGGTFAEICEVVAEIDVSASATAVATMLQQWIADELLAADPQQSICAACGAGFDCGVAAGSDTCWCMCLPTLAAAFTDSSGCYCVICLKAKLYAQEA